MLVLCGGARSAQEAIGTLPLSEAKRVFTELAQACERDGGKLWGRDLHRPVLLVDPGTRKIVGNQADKQGHLVEQEGVFVGTLPKDRPVANAPIEWAGVHWAMVLVPYLGDTPEQRLGVLAHESFHVVQPELGQYVFGAECSHLEEVDGRVWMQLEWNALQAALAATDDARRAAVSDALDFRAARRAHFSGAADAENKVELREGLANYTGRRIAGRSDAEVVAYVAERRAAEDGFMRSFAYNSGPLYGYLLDGARDGWRSAVRADTDLGLLLAAAYDVAPDVTRAETRAAAYGGDALRAAEEQRARDRAERLATWKADLVDGPVLVLDLKLVTSGTMDTRKVHPFDAKSNVFTERSLIAKWGTLTVHDGAILEETVTKRGCVSLRGAAEDHRSGPGWTLELAPGWTIAPGVRPGDLVVREGS